MFHWIQFSRKVKNALHAKFAAGERTFAYVPLGYIRHPEIKNMLAVDEKNRCIIEKIFDFAFYGAGAAKNTKTLIAEKSPTAGWLNYQRYGTFASIYAHALEEKSYAWTLAQVKSILQ
ncbi:MAG: recombinase, partial [Clostridiales bacterium]|nr:recombinase [Clostridiales bacterium]